MKIRNSLLLRQAGVAVSLAAVLLVVGCSTMSDGGFAGTSNSGSNQGGVPPAAPVLAKVTVQGIAPPGTPGSSILTARVERDPVDFLLSFISRPAYAQAGTVVLAGFTVTAYGPTGLVVGTATSDSNGLASFDNLPPGNYRFVYTNPAFPDTTMMVLAVAAEGSRTHVEATPATTAAALVAISEAGGTDISGLDVVVFNQQVLSNPAFQAVEATVEAALTAGTPVFNPVTGVPTAPALVTEVVTAGDSVVTVVDRYPADGQTGVSRNTPIFVTFSAPMLVGDLPPIYQGWTVTHTNTATGVTVTVNSGNLSAYGSWSYSDSARTVAGLNVPAHSLLFTSTTTLAANAREYFNWQFNALPRSATTPSVPVTTSATAGVMQSWLFFTGP